MKQEKLIFTSFFYPIKSSVINAFLLAESIRTFVGSMAQAPIWFFMPDNGEKLSSKIETKLNNLNVELIPIKIPKDALQFPFSAEILASASAESKAIGQADFLVWLGNNTIVLQEPKHFVLPADKNLGFRPVHHTLVGSLYDKPLEPFWTLIYQSCQVPEDRIFPMTTHIDGNRIRPYFNAGLLITRPEKKLFQAWHDAFFNLYQKPDFQKFYQLDNRYVIFIHQAILSGVILSNFETKEIQELPATYNYPVHLYADDITDNRPSSFDELTTLRHEGFYTDPDWMKKMPASDSLKQWLAQRLDGVESII